MTTNKMNADTVIAALAALSPVEGKAVIQSLIVTDGETIRREMDSADERELMRLLDGPDLRSELEPIALELPELEPVDFADAFMPELDLSFPAPLCAHCQKSVTPSQGRAQDAT